jgi:hypothetical protein
MQKMHVTHPNDSMLTEVPKTDEEPLIDDLEKNIAWFEVDSDNVQIFREQNLGGIGEEDVLEDAEDGEVQDFFHDSSSPSHLQCPVQTQPLVLRHQRPKQT